MGIEFLRPWALLLLLVVPVSWWFLRRARGGRIPWPDRLALLLRAVLCTAIAAALAEPRVVATTEGRSTAFVLDVSESVPPAARAEAEKWVKTALLDRDPEREDVSLVVFADGAAIEVPFRGLGGLDPTDLRPLDPGRIGTILGREESDAEAGVRAAMATFPPGSARRILLLTDGNETRGDVVQAVRAAVASGVAVEVLPLRYRRTHEVLVEKVAAPPRAPAGRPVALNAVVLSTADGVPATVEFVDAAGNVLVSQEVTLREGRNPFQVRRAFDDPGLHRVTARVRAPGDGNPENDAATATVLVTGESRVLVAWRDAAEARPLMDALERNAIRADGISVVDFPADPGVLLPYGCVVLVDCSASEFSPEQQHMLAACVTESGLGLVALGGPNSFSAGAYGGTPLEEVLPVTMDVSQKRVLPNGAIVIVLHTCEFPQGNDWGRNIAKAVIRSLGVNDWFGCVVWDGQVRWAVPMTKGDRNAMLAGIDASNPMDMPSLEDCVREAVNGLEKTPAHLKHMVVISDGDPAMPPPPDIGRMVDLGISISAVAIEQHGPVDAMRPMTLATGGRYYDLRAGQVTTLPRIFLKEASVIRRSTVAEQAFQPSQGSFHEVLRGIDVAAAPPLLGYVLATAKQRAEVPLLGPEADPLLAIWRVGLAKTAAFTSDLAGRWGREWLGWDRYDRFVAQLVRTCGRSVQESPFSVAVEASGGAARAVLEAVDDDGNYVDGLAFEGRVIAGDGTTAPLHVVQTAPGRYEAAFDAKKRGVYMVALEHALPGAAPDADRVQARAALAVDYSPEHMAVRDDDARFRALEGAGARLLGPADRPFLGPVPEVRTAADAWRWVLLAAILLLPLEIAVRRVRIDPGPLVAALARRLRREPAAAPRAAGASGAPAAAGANASGAPPASAGAAGTAAATAAATAAPAAKASPAAPRGGAAAAPAPPDPGTSDLLKAKRRAKKRTRWEDNA